MVACILHNICLEGIDNNVEKFIEKRREPEYEEENRDREDQEYNDEG